MRPPLALHAMGENKYPPKPPVSVVELGSVEEMVTG